MTATVPLTTGGSSAIPTVATVAVRHSSVPDGFGAQLEQVLAREPYRKDRDNVSEEELFAGILELRIGAVHGSFVKDQFRTVLAGELERQASNGRVSYETAANRSLRSLARAGGITLEDASVRKAEAFRAAQLDRNKSALYDRTGGPDDPTIAIGNRSSAARAVERRLRSSTVA
jgi:hypothetical protein